MTTNSAELKRCECGQTHEWCKSNECPELPLPPAAQGEQSKDERISDLEAALRSVNAVAIERGDKYGACDQIDNDGQPYQSQWLADLLKGASGQAGSAEQVSERETPAITAEALLRSVYNRPDLTEQGREAFFREFMKGDAELTLNWGDLRMMAATARAALSAPERKVTDAELPPLPGPEIGLPWRMNGLDGRVHSAAYSSNQMREYALAALTQQGEQTAPEGWITREEAFSMVTSGLPTADLIKQSFAMGAAFRMDQFKPDNLMTIAQSGNVTAMRNALMNISRALKARTRAKVNPEADFYPNDAAPSAAQKEESK